MTNCLYDPCCCKNTTGFTFEKWKDAFIIRKTNSKENEIPEPDYVCSVLCLPISTIALVPCLLCVCCKEYELKNTRRENKKLLEIIDKQPKGPRLTSI